MDVINYGVDTKIKNKHGKSAYNIAIERGNAKLLHIILLSTKKVSKTQT